MRYLGGKSRVAKAIALAILADTDTRTAYVEPFVGGGATFAELAPHFDLAGASDASRDLMMMWRAVGVGWVPPSVVTEAEYALQRDELSSALRGFVGFGCSFGGKWFGGYARGGVNADGTPRNHAAESARNVMAGAAEFKRAAVLKWMDYRGWTGAPGMVIYADPPYAGTTGYDAVDGWDGEQFYETCDRWVREGAEVYVSGYACDRDWPVIWSRPVQTSLTKAGAGIAVEVLYRVQANGS